MLFRNLGMCHRIIRWRWVYIWMVGKMNDNSIYTHTICINIWHSWNIRHNWCCWINSKHSKNELWPAVFAFALIKCLEFCVFVHDFVTLYSFWLWQNDQFRTHIASINCVLYIRSVLYIWHLTIFLVDVECTQPFWWEAPEFYVHWHPGNIITSIINIHSHTKCRNKYCLVKWQYFEWVLLWFSWFHLVQKHQTITFLITIFLSCSTTRFYMGVVKFKWNNFLQNSWCRRNENTSKTKMKENKKCFLSHFRSYIFFYLIFSSAFDISGIICCIYCASFTFQESCYLVGILDGENRVKMIGWLRFVYPHNKNRWEYDPTVGWYVSWTHF